MAKWFTAAAFAALAAAPVAAQQQPEVISSGGFLLGRALYTSCISPEANEQLACRSYMMAIADSMAMHKDNGWAPQSLCAAENLQIAQLGSIYVEYIRRNPDKIDWTAASTAYNALAERFPCSRQN